MRAPTSLGRGPARMPMRQRSNMGSRTSQGSSMPAPVGGWDAVSPLAKMPPDRAIVLDNWFPQPGYIEVRNGHQTHAAGMGTGPVETLMAYNGLTDASSKLFAVANNSIYDITTSGMVGAASVSGLSTNRWQYVNFTNASNLHYLWCCSGVDTPQYYDGSSWATPTITGTGISSSDFINVCVHKNRLWFCISGTMNAAYLAVDAIQGAATKFPLGSIMSKGGYLVTIATWTHDAGNGPDDYIVFMSSRGQAAVYSGTDPGSDFALVGVYDMGSPLGYRCLTKVAGDLAFVGIDGVLPFSLARAQDRGAAATVAITANINNAMNAAARSYGTNFGWELVPYPKGTRAILNVPIQENQTQHQYVMNTLTGAWCRFTGMNANCWVVFQDDLYFGGNEGAVYQADTTAMDQGQPIDAIGQGAYSFYGNRGNSKEFRMIQPSITTDSNTIPAIGLSTDFKDNAILGTPSSASTASALYDTAIYDTDVYPVESRNVSNWTGISGVGQAASIHFRVKTGLESGVSLWDEAVWGEYWSLSTQGETVMRLNGFNVIYEVGEFL